MHAFFAESGAHYVRWVLGWVDNENELVVVGGDISDHLSAGFYSAQISPRSLGLFSMARTNIVRAFVGGCYCQAATSTTHWSRTQ